MKSPLILTIEGLVVETFVTNDTPQEEAFLADDGPSTEPCIKMATQSAKYPWMTCDYVACQW